MKYRLTVAMVLFLAAGLGVVLPLSNTAQAVPRPNDAVIKWQFKFTNKTPKPIVVTDPATNKPTLYWYFVFRVVNKTGEDRVFSPMISLYTKTGQLIRANHLVSPAVFLKVKKMINDPLLESYISLAGKKLLQGEDNAKTAVAIFRDFDPKAAEFDLFISGLSGEEETIHLPKPIEVEEIDEDGKTVKVKKTKILLNKTLNLRYKIGKEFRQRSTAECHQVLKRWIMR